MLGRSRPNAKGRNAKRPIPLIHFLHGFVLVLPGFLVQGQTFKKVRFLKTTGDKTNEIKAHLIVTEDSIQVRDSQSLPNPEGDPVFRN